MNAVFVRLHQLALKATLSWLRVYYRPRPPSIIRIRTGKNIRKAEYDISGEQLAASWGGWLCRDYSNARVLEWIRKTRDHYHMTFTCYLNDAEHHRVEEKQIMVTIDHVTKDIVFYEYMHYFSTGVLLDDRVMHCVRYVLDIDLMPAWQLRLCRDAIASV